MNRPPSAAPQVKESTLPGVGKKYVMPLEEGGHVAVIVKPDGERQLYHFLPDQDRPSDVLTLAGGEAQQVAQLLGPTLVPAPDHEDLQIALGQLDLEWIELDADSPMTGQTLLESDLRRRTGASVIAVLRGGEAIPNPPVEQRFEAGDTLVIIGTPAQCDAARVRIEGDEA